MAQHTRAVAAYSADETSPLLHDLEDAEENEVPKHNYGTVVAIAMLLNYIIGVPKNCPLGSRRQRPRDNTDRCTHCHDQAPAASL